MPIMTHLNYHLLCETARTHFFIAVGGEKKEGYSYGELVEAATGLPAVLTPISTHSAP